MASDYARVLAQMNSRQNSMSDFIMKTIASQLIQDVFQDVDPAEKWSTNLIMSETKAMTSAENLYYNQIERTVKNQKSDLLGVLNSFKGDTKPYTKDGVVDYMKQYEDMKTGMTKYISNVEKQFLADGDELGSYSYRNPITGEISKGYNERLGNMANQALNTLKLSQTGLLNNQLHLAEIMTDRDILKDKLLKVGGDTGTGIKYNFKAGADESNSVLTLINKLEKEINEGMSYNSKIPAEALDATFIKDMADMKKALLMARQFDMKDEIGIQLEDKAGDILFDKGQDKDTSGAVDSLLKHHGMDITQGQAADAVDRWMRAGDYKKALAILDRMLPHKGSAATTRALLAQEVTLFNKKMNGILDVQGNDEAGLHKVALGYAEKISNQTVMLSPTGGFLGWGEELARISDTEMDFYNTIPQAVRGGFKSLAKILTPINAHGRARSANQDFDLSEEIPILAESGKEMFKMLIYGDSAGSEHSTTYLNSKDGKMYGMKAFTAKDSNGDKIGSVIDINTLSDEAVIKLISDDLKIGGATKFGLKNNINNESVWNTLYLGSGKKKFNTDTNTQGFTTFGLDMEYSHLNHVEGEGLQAFGKLWVKKNQGVNQNQSMLKTLRSMQGTEKAIDDAPEEKVPILPSDPQLRASVMWSETDWSKPLPKNEFSIQTIREAIEIGEHGAVKDTTTSVTNAGLNTDDTEDLGSYGFNTAWTNKADKDATGKDKNFAFNNAGDEDTVYNLIQKGLNKTIPGFSAMSNEDRKTAFLELSKDDQWKYANTVYQNRGLAQWSSLDSIKTVLGQESDAPIAEKAPIGFMRDPEYDHGWVPIPKDPDDPSLIVLKDLGLRTGIDEQEGGFIDAQAGEVKVFREQLNNLREENPDVYKLLENLDRLEENYKKVVSEGYHDTGLGKALGYNEDIGFEEIRTSINKEVEMARQIFDLAKEYGMTEWYSNVGDQADAGYNIIRDINKKGADSKFDNSKIQHLVTEFNVLQDATDKIVAPVVNLGNEDFYGWRGAEKVAGRSTSPISGSNMFRPGSLGGGGFAAGKSNVRAEMRHGIQKRGGVATESEQKFLTGKERLQADIVELNNLINSQDPKLNNANIRSRFTKLTSRYDKEFAELEGMAGTEQAALAVLELLEGGGNVYAQIAD